MLSLTSMRALAPGACAPRARGAKHATIAQPRRVAKLRVSAAGDVADFADAQVRCRDRARGVRYEISVVDSRARVRAVALAWVRSTATTPVGVGSQGFQW
jgi:hypothetical protein